MISNIATLLARDDSTESRPVALGPRGLLSWGQFQQRVKHWEGRLAGLAAGPIAIQQPDPGEFIACLWATWRAGRVAVISTSGFRDLVHALPASKSGDMDLAFTAPFDGAALPTDMPADTTLVLFTSGSTGVPQAVPKSLAQLDAELGLLDSLWGESVADTLVVTMVSHHHMFGLPFGLLWPMSRGALFYTRTVHYPEPLERLAASHRLTLICSPVHLQHLPDNLNHDLARTRVAQVFSAGAALSEHTAARCQILFGKPVTEIYGSTETGAVACREQPAETLWRCLPGISVDSAPLSRQLRITSPALGRQQPLVVADLAHIQSATSFSLAGRSDRIAKVGGKRISLTALETALHSHPWVREARVVPLAVRKDRLGAIIVLTSEGNSALIDSGRQAINRLLKTHITGPVEPLALPRYWRYVARLPVNSQGKTTAAALVDLFVSARQSRLPTLLDSEEVVAGNHYRLHLHIPDSLYYFNGHFPGNPVLPGVVQTDWAIHYGRQHFNGLDEFRGLEAIKFQHIIQPGATVTLDLQWQAERGKLQFSYQSPRARHASGRVLFSREGAAW